MLKIGFIPPTLKSMTFNTISLELWKQSDIVNELKHLLDPSNEFIYLLSKTEKWSNIVERVVEKISHLSLPELLQEEAKEAINMTGIRITAWLINVIRFLPTNDISDYIHLNLDCGIDRKQRAASILKSIPNTDPYLRYSFACFNCLEDDVRSLWKELPVDERNIILGKKSGYIRGDIVSNIVIFWSCSISQDFHFLYTEIGRDYDINDYFIQWSLRNRNIVAFKYFLEKLSEEEKRKNIVKYALVYVNVFVGDTLNRNLEDGSIDIFHYFGSEMNEVQLKEMFEQNPYQAMYLWCWCEYWHQGLISLDKVWHIIPPVDYIMFLRDFLCLYMAFPNENEFLVRKDRRVFQELWKNTPNNIKRGFFENVERVVSILCAFIITADVENLQLIFDDATVEERKEIINASFPREYLLLCVVMIYGDVETLKGFKKKYLYIGELDDFVQDIESALNQNKRNGDLWPLLNTLNTWKKRFAS